MAKINPHIHYNGNTEEAFEFYKSVFGGAIEFFMGDSPWGSYFGAFRGKYGVGRMVDFTGKKTFISTNLKKAHST